MKDLIVPEDSENSVNISEINEDYEGIIIGFDKNDKEVGYIYYDERSWYYANTINYTMIKKESKTLNSLIKDLIKDDMCNSFKVLQFWT